MYETSAYTYLINDTSCLTKFRYFSDCLLYKLVIVSHCTAPLSERTDFIRPSWPLAYVGGGHPFCCCEREPVTVIEQYKKTVDEYQIIEWWCNFRSVTPSTTSNHVKKVMKKEDSKLRLTQNWIRVGINAQDATNRSWASAFARNLYALGSASAAAKSNFLE